VRLAELLDGAQRGETLANAATSPLPVLRQKYLDLTDFVLASVRPKYEAHGLECAPETVAAIAATLYIAETRRDGL